MIVKSLHFSNWLSYGEDNYIQFDAAPLTQITGNNGAGKSSISVILDEILYGKNSKGIKKEELANRNIKKCTISGTLDFEHKGSSYTINYSRYKTVKLELLRNGIDISGHTATDTYKIIEEIIGLDYKTYAQLVYQSSTTSLQFLTATDGDRKKFLTALFGLEHYTDLSNLVKQAIKDFSVKQSFETGRLELATVFLEENKVVPERVEVPEDMSVPTCPHIQEIKDNIASLATTNQAIARNIKLKEKLRELPPEPEAPEQLKIQAVSNEIAVLASKITAVETDLRNIQALKNSCHVCLQPVDQEAKATLVTELQEKLKLLKDERATKSVEQASLQRARDAKMSWVNEKTRMDQVRAAIRDDLPNKELDLHELQASLLGHEKLLALEMAKYNQNKVDIRRAISRNTQADTIRAQLETFQTSINESNLKIVKYKDILGKLGYLKTILSPQGLISYKLEFLVKQLESVINEYLVQLSDGKYRLSFKLEDDKLNIHINESLSVLSLSAGELARINVAVLLAIRKMLNMTHNSSINLLLLDEVAGVLDEFGKQTLVELLLKESKLNCFLVDHTYTHPLLPRIVVSKVNGVSVIEE